MAAAAVMEVVMEKQVMLAAAAAAVNKYSSSEGDGDVKGVRSGCVSEVVWIARQRESTARPAACSRLTLRSPPPPARRSLWGGGAASPLMPNTATRTAILHLSGCSSDKHPVAGRQAETSWCVSADGAVAWLPSTPKREQK